MCVYFIYCGGEGKSICGGIVALGLKGGSQWHFFDVWLAISRVAMVGEPTTRGVPLSSAIV